MTSLSFAQLSDTIKTQNIKEVVVSGTRVSETQPVTQITIIRESIQNNYTGEDFNILANRTPSIIEYSDAGSDNNGYSYIRLRGIDQTRINFTLDGIPMQEPEDNGFYASNYTDFLNNISSVQIQRGVGIQNGAASFGGSVNFETRSLFDSAYENLQAGYGSFNSARASVSFATGQLKSGLSATGSYSSITTDGYRYHSGYAGQDAYISLGYVNGDNILKLNVLSGREKSQMAYLGSSIEDINTNRRNNPLSPDEKDDFQQSLESISYSRKTGSNSCWSTTAYHIGLNGGYTTLLDTTMYNFQLFSDMLGANTTFAYLSDKFNLRIGVEDYSYYRNHSMQVMPLVSEDIYSNRGTKNELSAFVKSSYYISKKLELFEDLQIRYVKFSYNQYVDSVFSLTPVTWNFINSNFGATYHLTKNQNLYFSIGQTHREPTRNDMLVGADNAPSPDYNLNSVKQESVIDYEFGYRYSDKKFNLSTNLFYMDFTNQIAAIGEISHIGLPLTENVDKSQRYGWETQYNWSVTKRFVLSGNLTVMKANIKDYNLCDSLTIVYHNVTPLLTPKFIVNQNATYWLIKNKFAINASCSYTSQSFLNNENNNNFILPSTLMFSAGVQIKPTKNLSLSFICNNLTNISTYNSGYTDGTTSYYYVAALRNLYITGSYIF
jgi:iron complex outermembrane receptor protein